LSPIPGSALKYPYQQQFPSIEQALKHIFNSPNRLVVYQQDMAGKFSPKNLRTEKIPRQIIFISIKAFNKSAVHKRKFSAELVTIQVIVIENNHNNRGFIFPLSRKKSFTSFT